jgi:tetratricopeptide (TPR) repeat protein
MASFFCCAPGRGRNERDRDEGHRSGGGSHRETASFAVTADRQQLLHRLLALGGLWLFLAGLLTATGFVVVAVVVTAALLLVALAVGSIFLLRGLPVGRGLRSAFDQAARADRALASGVRRLELGRRARGIAVQTGAATKGLAAQTSAAATATPGRTRRLVDSSGQRYAGAVNRLATVTSKAIETGDRLVGPLPARLGGYRRALVLNERGTQLRRQGDPEQAAEQHRVALAITRDLGDPRAEALTLNSLGLALAQGGADAAAVRQFEQALEVLRELGDVEYEARVIANLGSVHRRQGRRDEAVSLLSEALEKLPPESPAYRQVAEQLQQAS